MTVSSAIYTRWNAQSLNTSIAKLYPGEDEAPPAKTACPRASYTLENETDDRGSHCVATRETVVSVGFILWHTNYDAAEGWKSDIETAFHGVTLSITGFQFISFAGATGPTDMGDGIWRIDVRFDIHLSKAQPA